MRDERRSDPGSRVAPRSPQCSTGVATSWSIAEVAAQLVLHPRSSFLRPPGAAAAWSACHVKSPATARQNRPVAAVRCSRAAGGAAAPSSCPRCGISGIPIAARCAGTARSVCGVLHHRRASARASKRMPVRSASKRMCSQNITAYSARVRRARMRELDLAQRQPAPDQPAHQPVHQHQQRLVGEAPRGSVGDPVVHADHRNARPRPRAGPRCRRAAPQSRAACGAPRGRASGTAAPPGTAARNCPPSCARRSSPKNSSSSSTRHRQPQRRIGRPGPRAWAAASTQRDAGRGQRALARRGVRAAPARHRRNSIDTVSFSGSAGGLLSGVIAGDYRGQTGKNFHRDRALAMRRGRHATTVAALETRHDRPVRRIQGAGRTTARPTRCASSPPPACSTATTRRSTSCGASCRAWAPR